MGDQAVIYVNTALLIFIAGMMIGFGRWLVLKLHTLDLAVTENCIEIKALKETTGHHSGSIGKLEVGLAVHAASAHCGENEG